jgi:Asp-tRNA(Asn)/Glu-tRNA(Gln) amidotransferase A subunit family amidase
VIPLSVSLDHVGPIGRTVADVAAILGAIAGYDAADKSSLDAPVEDYVAALRKNFQPLRIGVPRKFFYDDLDKEVASATTHALSGLATLGAEIRDIELKVSTDRTLQSGESYAFHAQFAASKAELYQPETLRRILTGKSVSQEALLECRRELERERREITSVFAGVDVLATPTTPIPAPTIAELKQLHRRRFADWPADRWAALGRSTSAAGRSRLRAGDGMAQAPAAYILSRSKPRKIEKAVFENQF